MSDPFASRLSLFTGKGGVGKSTVVAAIALEARRRGKRPLVVELGHRASMQSIFGASAIGYAPTEVAPGVHASNVDLERALADYIARHVPSGALARRIARSPTLRRFLGAAPAVAEVLTLARLEALLDERASGAPRWDPLLVDFDATGHALMFLELPHVFESLVGEAGPVRRLLDSFAALLSDRAHTRLHIVTRPGKLPVQETLELCARITAEHVVPLGTLFVNHVPSAPPIDEPLLRELRARIAHPAVSCELELAERALHEQRAVTSELARLEGLALPTVRLPHLAPPIDLGALAMLGRAAGATHVIAELDGARLVVCVGPGGVGKTTLAAALAVDAAARGRRVALLTIDPARRLADALGGGALDDRLRRVPLERATGTLDAAMLETKASYDALIERIAEDPVALARILENRVYQAFSRTLARSHAYVAMERLHDVLAGGEYDLVVLDTPPTRSALDILDAPGRLLAFLDERVLGAFVPSRESAGRGAAAWLRARGSAALGRLFGALAGETVAGELAGFFEVFFHLRRGFAERAAVVQRELMSASTAFVLVSAPEATHLADAAYLRDGLLARGVPLRAYLFNRAFLPGEDGAPLGPGAPYDAEAVLDGAWPDAGRAREDALAAIAAARALRRGLALENDALDVAMRAFCHGGEAALRLRFPILTEEPTSVPALRALLGLATQV